MKHTLAIVGFGGMGGWHYENVTKKVPDIDVIGVYDVREEALEKARGLGLIAYESLDALLADPKVDIVTVATPNDFHKDIAIRAMRAGKTVISEKPVTLNSAQLEEIIAVSKETGRLFSIHQNRRWDRDYRIIKKLVDDNTIGQPYFIESRVQGSRGGSMHGWRGHKLNGGGMLLDWGVHLIDQMMNMISSPVVSVDAHLQMVFGDEVDDNIKVYLRFENGISAMLEMSTNCFIPLPRWHVQCLNGTVVVDDWSCKGRIMQRDPEAVMEWGDDIVYTEAGPTRTMAPRPPETMREIPLPDVKVDWSDYYNNIVGVLDRGEELIVKPEQALRVMKVIDALFESERTKTGLSVHI